MENLPNAMSEENAADGAHRYDVAETFRGKNAEYVSWLRRFKYGSVSLDAFFNVFRGVKYMPHMDLAAVIRR